MAKRIAAQLSVEDNIRHFQRIIGQIKEPSVLLQYIEKLGRLEVKMEHLEATGIGMTVNALNKYDGKVSVAATSLVEKWKAMVAATFSGSGEYELDSCSAESQPDSSSVESQPSSGSVDSQTDSSSAESQPNLGSAESQTDSGPVESNPESSSESESDSSSESESDSSSDSDSESESDSESNSDSESESDDGSVCEAGQKSRAAAAGSLPPLAKPEKRIREAETSLQPLKKQKLEVTSRQAPAVQSLADIMCRKEPDLSSASSTASSEEDGPINPVAGPSTAEIPEEYRAKPVDEKVSEYLIRQAAKKLEENLLFEYFTSSRKTRTKVYSGARSKKAEDGPSFSKQSEKLASPPQQNALENKENTRKPPRKPETSKGNRKDTTPNTKTEPLAQIAAEPNVAAQAKPRPKGQSKKKAPLWARAVKQAKIRFG